jgi:hypothetical protein
LHLIERLAQQDIEDLPWQPYFFRETGTTGHRGFTLAALFFFAALPPNSNTLFIGIKNFSILVQSLPRLAKIGITAKSIAACRMQSQNLHGGLRCATRGWHLKSWL